MDTNRNICIRSTGNVSANEVFYLHWKIEKLKKQGYSTMAIMYFLAEEIGNRRKLSLTFEDGRDVFIVS